MNRIKQLLNHLLKDDNVLVVSPNRDTSSYSAIPLSQLEPNTATKLRNIFNDRYDESIKVLEKHGRDIGGYSRTSPSNAVIFPISIKEIVSLVTICNNHQPLPISIIPYSAGTSLESHTVSQQNNFNRSLTLSFAKMNKIISIYPDDMQCTIQPGIGFMKLNKLLKKWNLFLGVDPAPSACIGGMLGTCCSGPTALRYGTMRNQVINMKIVLNNGKIIKTAQRAIKSVAGYNLNGLFIGSEGTLGIIVETTLRLRSIPKYIEIAQAVFNTNDWFSIGQCVKEINVSGIALLSFEFMDNNMINDCIKYDPKTNLIPNKNIILFKFGGPTKNHINADIQIIKNIVSKYTKYPFIFSKNQKERDRLWNVRKNSFWANKFANPGRNSISTDVAIPFSNFTKCIQKCKIEMDKSILYCPIVGHIGDGNWHCAMFYDSNNQNEIDEMIRLNTFIVDCALELNGTCTAEHGIGKNKKLFLYKELGTNTVEFMKSLKKHIDPNGIFCPGNIVDV